LKGFWQGQHALPKSIEPAQPATIPAMVIKKAVIFPHFGKNKTPLLRSWRILYQDAQEYFEGPVTIYRGGDLS